MHGDNHNDEQTLDRPPSETELTQVPPRYIWCRRYIISPMEERFQSDVARRKHTPRPGDKLPPSVHKGEPQKLVDSYRKSQYREPASILQEVWAELEKRFGTQRLSPTPY